MAAGVKSRVEQPELVEKRRGQIVAAAIELFGRHGYHPTTIRDIATRANVSIGLIYQYVEDKEDVLYLALIAVLDAYKREIPTALEGIEHPLERFCAAARAYTSRDRRQHPVHRAGLSRDQVAAPANGAPRSSRLESETNQLIAACIRDCVAAKLVPRHQCRPDDLPDRHAGPYLGVEELAFRAAYEPGEPIWPTAWISC